jgi:hypothetical protein
MHEDTKRCVASCPECQRTENISQRNSMPLKYNLQIDIFDVWGIDFMGLLKTHLDLSISLSWLIMYPSG